MYSIIKSILFIFSPEAAHEIAMRSSQILLNLPIIGKWIEKSIQPPKTKPVIVSGITFPNPIGLAAGFDKDAKWLDLLKRLGFGYVEVGTVTPKPQAGNPRPRLFRLPEDNALINRMGFNNEGVDAMVERLKKRPKGLIVGGNIGKNKITPNEEAINDYIYCFEAIYDYVDYIVVNISSPNTPGLRELQEEKFITELFAELQERRLQKSKWKPIYLKISPDFQQSAVKELIQIIKKANVDGVIATNTTISRDNLLTDTKTIEKIGPGGLSGSPLLDQSNTILSFLGMELGGDIPLIGVGGIFTKEDYEEKISRGASLVQIYTGFIYVGPRIVRKLLS